MSPPRPPAAACRGADPEVFFPNQAEPAEVERAVRICRRCPGIQECLSYALAHDVSGIWGGTTEDQRSTTRKRFNIRATPMHLPG